MPSREIELLVRSIEEAYRQKTWHGPNLRGSIRGLSAREANWRPGRGRHSIWEIALHCAYWKYTVGRRILGTKRGSFPLKGSNWFERPHLREGEMAWRGTVRLLDDTHRRMVAAIIGLSAARLNGVTKGSHVSMRQMIEGIAKHDVYHAGQIQLIKRLMK